MKTTYYILFLALGIFQPLAAQTGQLIGTIPSGMTVQVTYARQSQKDAASGAAPARDNQEKHLLYRGNASLVAVDTFSTGVTAYRVIVKDWQFSTDPTAPPKYRDYVQVLQFTPEFRPSSDFQELSFINSDAIAKETTLQGKPAILLTAAWPPSQFSPEMIQKTLEAIGNSPQRAAIEKRLIESQKKDEERMKSPPDRVWLDADTRLPLRAQVSDLTITYTYSPKLPAPVVPSFIKAEIVKQLGTMPEL